MEAVTSLHRPSVPPWFTIPPNYSMEKFQHPVFGNMAYSRESALRCNALGDDVRKEQRAGFGESVALDVASLCFSNGIVPTSHGSQEQTSAGNAMRTTTSVLLRPHHIAQYGKETPSRWPPSLSTSSGSATWMSPSSRGSPALPSPALLDPGIPSSSSFEGGFNGAPEMENVLAVAHKLRMVGVLEDKNEVKPEEQVNDASCVGRQNINNQPNSDQPVQHNQFDPSHFRNKITQPIPQPALRSGRSQMEIERAAAEQWNARNGRRPSSAAIPFGSTRPRNNSLPETYHGLGRSCPPPANRNWRGFPPSNDSNDGRRRGSEPFNQNANPYGSSRIDMRGGGDMDKSPFGSGMALNPYASAAVSPPNNFNRLDSRSRQNNGDFCHQKYGHPMAPPRGQQGMMNGTRSNGQKGGMNGQDRMQDMSGPRRKAYPPSLLHTPTDDFFASDHLESAAAAANSPQALQIIKSFGSYGSGEGEFNMPQGLCLGDEDGIIVADTLNHRIQILDKNGAYRCHWGSPGVKKGQLWHPRKVAFIPETQHVVVSDRVNGCSRIQIFTQSGEYLTTLGNLHGLRMALNTTTAGLTVYKQQIVVVEVQPAACVVLTEDGGVVYWFPLDGVMVEPSDIVVINQKHYISDFRDHSVCVFDSWGHMVQRLGPSSPEGSLFIRYPRGLGVSADGHLLVADTDLNRFHISVWDAETSQPLSYYALPDIKVSHSCGVVMTKSGHIVSAVKKESTVLIMGFRNFANGLGGADVAFGHLSNGSSRNGKSFRASGSAIAEKYGQQQAQDVPTCKSSGLNVHAPVFRFAVKPDGTTDEDSV